MSGDSATHAPDANTDGAPSDPAAAAHSYVALGWTVVPVHTLRGGACSCGRRPCAGPGKHPRVRWHRFETARPSAGQITAWWRRWPDANVGIVTGSTSDLVVLDIDPRNGGDSSLYAIERQWGVHPATVESISGGGGRHLWFRATEPFATTTIAPGCEVKGQGGIVVAPPSIHPSGGRYRWRAGHAPWQIPLAPPPAWLSALERPDHTAHHDTIPRTEQERDEFARLWARTGVVLRAGDHNYLCPLHDDHHPSLHVDAEGCRWYCFGCRRGGGIGALRRELRVPGRPRRLYRIDTTSSPATGPVTLADDIEIDVVGESAHQDDLLALTGGERSYGGVDVTTIAELVPSARAPGDPDAVDVCIEGRLVGRLRREDACSYRSVLAYTAREHGTVRCRARIRGGWDRGRDDVGAFGVRVFLPALDDVPPG